MSHKSNSIILKSNVDLCHTATSLYVIYTCTIHPMKFFIMNNFIMHRKFTAPVLYNIFINLQIYSIFKKMALLGYVMVFILQSYTHNSG
jgi:hypothetical protein